jgi:hypothetical protein
VRDIVDHGGKGQIDECLLIVRSSLVNWCGFVTLSLGEHMLVVRSSLVS